MTEENNKFLDSQAAQEETAPVHKRRVRYKGTHPRTFEEKYKERNPEKYQETVEKVMAKGSTPAGMHRSIMVDEILSFLQIQPGQKGLDATLGYGGHTQAMLGCLEGEEKVRGDGHLYGLDVDPIEIEKTKKRLADLGYGEDILTVIQTNFVNIDQVAAKHGKFDFILADLGVSSMQIDNPERGFTFKADGPLDLRLDPEHGVSAAERLMTINKDELEGMLTENADEPYAAEIARTIVTERKKGRAVKTTVQLKEAVEKALKKALEGKSEAEQKELVQKSCKRTFQALRIDVNDEFEVLDAFLEKLPGVLNPGGRVAILTFHSGEDRRVKQSFRYYSREGIYAEAAKDVIRPSAAECVSNSRAHSTKLRWAIRA